MSNCLIFLTVDPPKITQHPESKSIATGASTTLTVEASGDGLQFKWKKDGKDLHDGSKYCGTKTHTLHINDVGKRDKGGYQCLVENDVGEKLSEEADLAVGKLVVKLIPGVFLLYEKLSFVTWIWCTHTLSLAFITLCNGNVFPSHKKRFATYLSNCLIFLTVDPPKITQHPKSKSVATGTSPTLNVEASGGDLNLFPVEERWQRLA